MVSPISQSLSLSDTEAQKLVLYFTYFWCNSLRSQKPWEPCRKECTNLTNKILIWGKTVAIIKYSPKGILLGLLDGGSNILVNFYKPKWLENKAGILQPCRIFGIHKANDPHYCCLDIQAIGITCGAYHVRLWHESYWEWFFWPEIFEHSSFLGKKQENISNSLVWVIFAISTK